MKNIVTSFVMCVAIGGCGLVPTGLKRQNTAATDAPVVDATGPVAGGAQTRPQARPDTGTTPSTPEPATPAATSGALGTTIASLGSPAEPGLWLKTPLVASNQSGKVSYKGKTITVTLIPIEGPKTAGSRLSLQGFQALGASLTDLVELSISL